MLICLFVMSVTLSLLVLTSAIAGWLQAERDYERAFLRREIQRERCLQRGAAKLSGAGESFTPTQQADTGDAGHWRALLMEQLEVIEDLRDASFVTAMRME